MASTNKSSDIKKKATKKLQNEVKKEVKKEARKTIRKVTRPEVEEKGKGKQPSALHQFAPFILFALSLLIAVCLIGAELAQADMGIAGNFISMVFCGLLGIGAFLLPVVLVFMGIIWFNNTESQSLKGKVIFALISILLLSAITSTAMSFSADPSFNVPELWTAGTELAGGGLLGGLLCSVVVVMFKSVGALIIFISALLISLMFMLNITPKNVWTYIKYKNKLRHERKMALLTKRAEEEAAAEERRKEEEAREPKPEKVALAAAAAATVVTQDPAPVSEEEAKKTFLRLKKRELIEEESKKPAPEVVVNNNDEPDVAGIFSDDSIGNADISLEEKAEATAAEKPKAVKVKKPGGDMVLSMKDGKEEQKELDSLVGGEGSEPVMLKKIYAYPPTTLLKEDTNPKGADVSAEMNENAAILRETLASFNIGVKDQILCSRGPTITRYELRPEVGVRVRSIANLVDDISLSLATSGVRIEAPIPNKPYVGIEVPNRNRLTVFLRSLIENEKFANDQSKLIACLGADVGGHPVFFDITKMPHLLIAGATGMGKSVCINSIIMSILYKATPDEVKLILIDPKKVEFSVYKDIPHLYAPIVSDPKKAAGALASAVAEMERRFQLIEDVGVRDINNYNAVTANDPDREYLPKMVIIIDELADLMMTAPGEVESSICRLAQKARAAGIHIIIGTQRPSVDVITGLIKANIPSRIACTVASQVDSRTIIDIAGAEKLIGRGDMLFAPVGISKPMRVQGCFVSDAEVESVVEFIKANNSKAEYNKDFVSLMESESAKVGNAGKKGGGDDGDGGGDSDPMFRDAVKLAIDAGKISTSLLQRMMSVGYGRAAKLIDKMEAMGYVSAPEGNKPRRVLITMQEYMEKVINDDIDSGEPESDEE